MEQPFLTKHMADFGFLLIFGIALPLAFALADLQRPTPRRVRWCFLSLFLIWAGLFLAHWITDPTAYSGERHMIILSASAQVTGALYLASRLFAEQRRPPATR